MLPVDEKP